MLNTGFDYLYRDADNYKCRYQAIVRGEMTREQIETIIDCCEDRIYFLPEQVGLPFGHLIGFEFDPQSDHPWCEQESVYLTPLAPTVNMTAEELVAAFVAAKGNWREDL